MGKGLAGRPDTARAGLVLGLQEHVHPGCQWGPTCPLCFGTSFERVEEEE